MDLGEFVNVYNFDHTTLTNMDAYLLMAFRSRLRKTFDQIGDFEFLFDFAGMKFQNIRYFNVLQSIHNKIVIRLCRDESYF